MRGLALSLRSALLLSTVLLLLPAVGEAQLRPAAPLQEAYFAWDEGRYIEAMEGYLEVLRGPEGETHRREAALLTGELHPVRELDDDGRELQLSPDDRYLAWSRQVDGAWWTHVEPREGGERRTLPSQMVALSAAGHAAYVSDDGLQVMTLATGEVVTTGLDGLRPVGLAFAPDEAVLWIAAGEGEGDEIALHRAAAPEWTPEAVTMPHPVAVAPMPLPGGEFVLFQVPNRSPLAPSGEDATPTGGPGLGILDTTTGEAMIVPGGSPAVSRDGSFFALHRPGSDGEPNRIVGASLDQGLPGEQELVTLVESELRIGDPALSPTGDRLAYKAMPHTDWEIFLVPTDGSAALSPGTAADPAEGIERVTREIQHDQFPDFIDDRRLLALKGEWRHRRSYLYDLETGEEYRIFHNNTLRTIAPEYEWVPSSDGEGILMAAERDGNTIDPERGVFWVDLTREVTLEDLIARLEANLAHERVLLAEGEAAFAPIADEVRQVTEGISPGRVFLYADALYRMGSKFIGQPGNLPAVEYLTETLESWGYEVEQQWFEPRGIRSANVIARLPGTENPEMVYVISSHFDSVLPSPGADDNTSGTTAMLEAARVLAESPRKATVEFVLFTAEEAGLIGAREYVARAVDEGKWIVGVLNNDMIGWTRSHRLDNTVRYSNPGIMRLQHAASHFFSDLITYDALYTRGTDGQVFYDAYGDIVGGIGSYPVLGNPNYHQRTDQIETINHRLVAEVSRTTAATIMLLADGPARIEELRVEAHDGDRVEVAWSPSPENGVTGYRVRVVSADGAEREVGVVSDASTTVEGVAEGDRIEVRAVRDNGTEGWDWTGITP